MKDHQLSLASIKLDISRLAVYLLEGKDDYELVFGW